MLIGMNSLKVGPTSYRRSLAHFFVPAYSENEAECRKPCCHKNIRKCFVSVMLSIDGTEATIHSSSVNTFKNHLQRLQNTRMGFFMD